MVPDGVLDEPIWEMAEDADEFWEYFPLDSIQARKQSQIKMLYDDKNLYIGIKAYSSGENYATQSLNVILEEVAVIVFHWYLIRLMMALTHFCLESIRTACVVKPSLQMEELTKEILTSPGMLNGEVTPKFMTTISLQK